MEIDLLLYVITFACTILIGIQIGVATGIVLSLLLSFRFKSRNLSITSLQNKNKVQLQIKGDICFLNVDTVIDYIREDQGSNQNNILKISNDGLVDSTAVQKLQRLAKKLDLKLEFN